MSVDLEESEIWAIGENPDRRTVWATGGTSGGQVSATWAEAGVEHIGIHEVKKSGSFKSRNSEIRSGSSISVRHVAEIRRKLSISISGIP
jgi:hypothetical protein